MTDLATPPSTEPCADCPDDSHFGPVDSPVTDAAWDGSASRFTDEQYRRAAAACEPGSGTENGPTVKEGCILPHHEPDGRTNRNGVHAAAQRASQVSGRDQATVDRAKAHLRAHYRALDEEPPDSLTAAASPAAVDEGLVAVEGVLCVEGEQTGDGRIMAPGSITWADPPLPIAWLEDEMHGDLLEGGCQIGILQSIVRDGALVRFTGALDTGIPEAAELVRRMRAGSAPGGDRFPLSIDPDDWEVEVIDTEPVEEDDMVVMLVASGSGRPPAFTAPLTAAAGDADPGGEVVMEDSSDRYLARYTRLRIRGVTALAIGAFDSTYMQLAEGAATAVEQPPAEAESAPQSEQQGVTVTIGLAAAGGPVLPPRAWFENPGFGRGDPRLVRQPDGQTLCPLTVTDDGRVYGHMFGWKSCHTAIASHCQPPPRSASGYAYFNRRPIPTAEGDPVHVGVLSMGCGHADLSLDWRRAQAHYDGGPGAVQMADVTVGADEHGAWFAGALRPGVTDEQVRAFRACSVSGDWREVSRGSGIDLVACLAGVTSPGFIVTGMAASAAQVELVGPALGEPRGRYEDGRPVALVAAGVVRQPDPWERGQGALAARLEAMEQRLAATERVTKELRSDAASRLRERLIASGGIGFHVPEQVVPAEGAEVIPQPG